MADQVDKKVVDEDDDDKHSWQSIDVTFSASLLSSMAASYGLSVGRNAPKKKEEPKADPNK